VRESGWSEAAPLGRTGNLIPHTRTNRRTPRKTREGRLITLQTAHGPSPIIQPPHVTSSPIQSSPEPQRADPVRAPHVSPMPASLWRREGVSGRRAALRALHFFFFPQRSPVDARFRSAGGDAARKLGPADPFQEHHLASAWPLSFVVPLRSAPRRRPSISRLRGSWVVSSSWRGIRSGRGARSWIAWAPGRRAWPRALAFAPRSSPWARREAFPRR
jgi:hypothetical protein